MSVIHRIISSSYILTCTAVAVTSALAILMFNSARSSVIKPMVSQPSIKDSLVTTEATRPMGATPVYFLSHGGPNVMFETEHPAYAALQSIGKEITGQKPKAIIVFSAHWQAGYDHVEINTAEVTDLIYDYYGFPDRYYDVKYPNVGSKDVAQRVISSLQAAGINVKGVKRGLDHGVFAGFMCLFDPQKNPIGVPIVQVSLFGNNDPHQHYRTGRALADLRKENYQIIGSGMSVHNLRDLRFSFGNRRPLPYTVSFDEALRDAVTAPAAEREARMAALLKRPDASQAHPTIEHLLPVYIAAGAAAEDVGKQLFTLHEGSMGWAMFKFG